VIIMRWMYERFEPQVCGMSFAAFDSKSLDNILLTSTKFTDIVAAT
jgi:hypothetical protein